MKEDFTVTVDYRNRDMEKIGGTTYAFKDYVSFVKLELMRVIMDVEDAFYDLQGGLPKEKWDEKTLADFQKIRHKLLDQANAIERLPQTLHYKGVSCASRNLGEVLTEYITHNMSGS